MTASLWEDDSIESPPSINKYKIDIDENGEWEMPEGVSPDEERNITFVMELYIERKWDANDYDRRNQEED